VTYSVLLIRQIVTGTAQAFSIAVDVALICDFVIAMVAIASYAFTREVNMPF
jgi:ABC-2 type transport system permease protein